jgi:hypothetical protein
VNSVLKVKSLTKHNLQFQDRWSISNRSVDRKCDDLGKLSRSTESYYNHAEIQEFISASTRARNSGRADRYSLNHEKYTCLKEPVFLAWLAIIKVYLQVNFDTSSIA